MEEDGCVVCGGTDAGAITRCGCSGGRMHDRCLRLWLTRQGEKGLVCEVCGRPRRGVTVRKYVIEFHPRSCAAVALSQGGACVFVWLVGVWIDIAWSAVYDTSSGGETAVWRGILLYLYTWKAAQLYIWYMGALRLPLVTRLAGTRWQLAPNFSRPV